jgi:hypothetical protein
MATLRKNELVTWIDTSITYIALYNDVGLYIFGSVYLFYLCPLSPESNGYRKYVLSFTYYVEIHIGDPR